jgi:hypothetical protein
MQKILLLVLLVIALSALGYYLYASPNTLRSDNPSDTPATAISETKTIKETADAYTIDVAYRHVGNAAIDSQIDAEVNAVIAAFKKDAGEYEPQPGMPPYTLSGEFSDVNISADIVSERVDFYQDTGGAHGLPIALTLNYDAHTGRKLELNDALSLIGLTLDQVSAQSLAKLKAEFGESVFTDGAAPRSENYGTFIIDMTDVTFIFQAYQVVAYAAGMPEVTFDRK